MSDPIRLQDVPARFFNPKYWKILRSRTPDETMALCLFNAPYPDPDDPTDLLRVYGRSDKKAVELYRIGRRLLKDYRRRLINGDHIATGVRPDGKRVTIRSSDWIDLWPWFATGRANGPGIILNGIEIHESDAAKRQQACEEWLAAYPELSSQKKGSVFHTAKSGLGDGLSHAIFNAAYKQILGRKRGRPVAIKRKK